MPDLSQEEEEGTGPEVVTDINANVHTQEAEVGPEAETGGGEGVGARAGPGPDPRALAGTGIAPGTKASPGQEDAPSPDPEEDQSLNQETGHDPKANQENDLNQGAGLNPREMKALRKKDPEVDHALRVETSPGLPRMREKGANHKRKKDLAPGPSPEKDPTVNRSLEAAQDHEEKTKENHKYSFDPS